MFFEDLPTEIIVDIYLHIPKVQSVLTFSSTCHRLRTIYKSSSRLAILSQAAEAEYGPTDDIVQLITHNTSQPAHLPRAAALSDALITSIIEIGRVAARWEDIYPYKKWKTDFANRRLLDDNERFLVRRALYRLWLFGRAFHNSMPQNGRLNRSTPQAISQRALLLHNFSTGELAEMLDVHNVLRDVVSNNVCPSNGTIRRKFQKRYPDSNHQLLFNIHLNYPPSASSTFGSSQPSDSDDAFYNHYRSNFGGQNSSLHQDPKRHHHARFVPTRTHEPGGEGWGDDVLHYYVVEDMLKLDPAQILLLRDRQPLKRDVEAYVRSLGDGGGGGGGGDWFDNNGETFCQSLAHVAAQRGADLEEIKAAVDEGALGVALSDLD